MYPDKDLKTVEKPEKPLSPKNPREGWEDQFALMAENGDDQLLEELFITEWDDEEWTW